MEDINKFEKLFGGMILGRSNFQCLTRSRGWVKLAGVVLTVLSCSVDALTAYSLRNKELIENGDQSYWQVRVTCSDLTTRRFITQQDEEGPWCARDVPEMCAIEKIDVAISVCSSEYRDALEIQRASNQERDKLAADKDKARTELLEEKVLLQQQQVELVQRKLELRRREVDLQSRELNLLERKARLQ
ncbi:MAG: hypothetical protein KTR35_13085 [Gammaproteobacteria bacterium]|nr:hypothetical protein [Gammaproteobacteria bacterium]